MPNKTFVDNDGNELSCLTELKNNIKNNPFEIIEDDIVNGDDTIHLLTRFSGLGKAFKTIASCVDNTDNKYHRWIRYCDGEDTVNTQHEDMISIIESNETPPDITIEED